MTIHHESQRLLKEVANNIIIMIMMIIIEKVLGGAVFSLVLDLHISSEGVAFLLVGCALVWI